MVLGTLQGEDETLSLEFEVIGLEELKRKFDRLSGENKRAINEALETVGKEIVYEAQRLAPVRTGRLRDSIYYMILYELALEVGASAPYALFVEYGTWKMHAQPFLRPALQDGRVVVENLEKAIRDFIEEVCR